MRKCPFCGEEIRTDFPYLSFLEGSKKWNLTHTCPHPNEDIGVWVDIYGETVQECFDKWNGVNHEEQASESL